MNDAHIVLPQAATRKLLKSVFCCVVMLCCFGQIGCTTSLTEQVYQNQSVLHGILVEDRSAGVANYRIANLQEWRRIRVTRKGKRLDVAPNMVLEVGDNIKTGPDMAAAIRFPNGSQLYVRSNSHIRIGSVFAFVGELFVRVKGAFQVDTEFVTAGAEGTEWVMSIAPNGDTRCTVLEGRIRLASKKNYWRSKLIASDSQHETLELRRSQTNPPSSEELNKMKGWIGQIDQLLRTP